MECEETDTFVVHRNVKKTPKIKFAPVMSKRRAKGGEDYSGLTLKEATMRIPQMAKETVIDGWAGEELFQNLQPVHTHTTPQTHMS